MSEVKNVTEEKKELDKYEKMDLNEFEAFSDRHIQIRIMKATERTAKNIAFYFWCSIISAGFFLLVYGRIINWIMNL